MNAASRRRRGAFTARLTHAPIYRYSEDERMTPPVPDDAPAPADTPFMNANVTQPLPANWLRTMTSTLQSPPVRTVPCNAVTQRIDFVLADQIAIARAAR